MPPVTCLAEVATAASPADTWMCATLVIVFMALATAALIVGLSLRHRTRVAEARATERAVRQRLVAECGQWCPKCGTVTRLRTLAEAD